MEEDLALELEAAQEGVGLEVGFVLEEDVVPELGSSHPSMEKMMNNRKELHFNRMKKEVNLMKFGRSRIIGERAGIVSLRSGEFEAGLGTDGVEQFISQ